MTQIRVYLFVNSTDISLSTTMHYQTYDGDGNPVTST